MKEKNCEIFIANTVFKVIGCGGKLSKPLFRPEMLSSSKDDISPDINVKQLNFLNIRKYASSCDITEKCCEKFYDQRPVI
uniref:Uncharacterized protein n=1 Tax=Glossina pallidipes TaxID=7398 RepID=A0A1B0AE17_GLOPL